MPPAIRIEQLTNDVAAGLWQSRTSRALDTLTLEITRGEVFGFLGPNVAGADRSPHDPLPVETVLPAAGPGPSS